MKSETFRKQALSLIIFFVAIAAVFALTRLRSDPAGKQARDHPDPAAFQLRCRGTGGGRFLTPPASRALCRWMTAALRLSIRHSSGIA